MVEQPLLPSTVTEYGPAVLTVRVGVVAPVLHRYSKGAVPPVTLAISVANGLEQVRFGLFTLTAGIAVLEITVVFAVVIQPFAPVTVTEYGPAVLTTRIGAVAPVLHWYVYGAMPPVILVESVPDGLVQLSVRLLTDALGCPMSETAVPTAEAEQPLALVTTTE